MRSFAAFIVMSALLIGILDSYPAQAEKKPLVIGFAIAKSGWMTVLDEDPSRFVQLAVEDINKEGGLLGRQIEMVFCDHKTDPALSSKCGKEVISQGAELLIATCDFGGGGPAAMVAQNAGVLAISLCSGSPKWGPQGAGPLVFSAGLAAQAEGYVMAEWGYKVKGFRTAYMLKDMSITYSRAMCVGFEDRWPQLAGKENLVGIDFFKNGDPSIASQVTRIRNLPKPPDFLFICTYIPGGASAVRQIRSAGIDIPILGGFDMDGSHWLDAAPNLSEFYYLAYGSVHGDDLNPKVNELVAKFAKRHGERPATSLGLAGYNLMQMYQRAVERAGTTDATAVAKELEKFKDEPLFTGPYTFTDKVHIQTKIKATMMEIQGGKQRSTGTYYDLQNEVPFDLLFKD